MNIKEKILLLFIIILGFAFRFYGINFDQSCCQHPDERAIIMYTLPLSMPKNITEFLSPESPLNPHFFAYGNFPLYLLKGTSQVVSIFNPVLKEYSYIDLVGRMISVIADITTILLIFLIGKTLKDKVLGFAAAFIYAISVLPIQYSHFYTSDILLTMFITLTIYRILIFYKNPGFKNAVLIGIPLGLSLSTKISAIPIMISISAALLLDFIFIFIKSPHKPKHWLPHLPHVLKKLLEEGVVIAILSVLTFVVTQPYTIINFSEFLKQNLAQSAMTRDAYTFPYTLQYVGKIPYFYEMKNIFLWGLGPIIFGFAVVGLILLIKSFEKLKQPKKSEYIIILSFAFLYFLIVGKFAVGFMRYMLPIYPTLALFSGLTLSLLFERIKDLKNWIKILIIAITIILLLIWPLSFMKIYTSTNTRIAATNWVNENVPTGSVLTHELWDDQIPLYTNRSYKFEDLGMYDQPDNNLKWQTLNSKLNQADYLIIASNRLYIPIEKLENCNNYKICFPIASKFYQHLFDGKLPFKKVAEFSSYPTVPILGLIINDQGADESFTVYDHPKIIIFKRIKK